MTPPRSDDDGSAVAEFVSVAGVLCLTVMAVLQLILVLHVRNTLVDCASEGARYAALQGNTPQQGAARAKDLIGSAISPDFAQHVSATVTNADGVQLVDVQVDAVLPLVGLFGVQTLTVHGHGVQDLP